MTPVAYVLPLSQLITNIRALQLFTQAAEFFEDL